MSEKDKHFLDPEDIGRKKEADNLTNRNQDHYGFDKNKWIKDIAHRRKKKMSGKELPAQSSGKPAPLQPTEIDEKPLLSMGDEIAPRKAPSEAKKSPPLWLWILIAAFMLIIITVIMLRFFGGGEIKPTSFDKPTISAASNWKTRPTDPGGAEVPFEDLQILDTTGNARLLQNHVNLLLPTQQTQAPAEETNTIEHDLEKEVALLLGATTPSQDALSHPTEQDETEKHESSDNLKAKIVQQPSEIPVSLTGVSSWQVQMSSVFSEKDAKAEWQRFSRRYGNIVSEQPALIVQSGNSYALRIGSFQSSREAQALCAYIKSAGGDCLPISPR